METTHTSQHALLHQDSMTFRKLCGSQLEDWIMSIKLHSFDTMWVQHVTFRNIATLSYFHIRTFLFLVKLAPAIRPAYLQPWGGRWVWRSRGRLQRGGEWSHCKCRRPHQHCPVPTPHKAQAFSEQSLPGSIAHTQRTDRRLSVESHYP